MTRSGPSGDPQAGARSASDSYRLDDPSRRQEIAFDIAPDAAERAALAEEMGLVALRKLRLSGRLVPAGSRDWDLDASLGATLVQTCGVTLVPVTTRVDETVTRRYLAALDPADLPAETEMPEDDNIEPLPRRVSLRAVMAEALALAIPPFPRAPGVDPLDAAATAPGAEPLDDDATRPFAGLDRKLRDT